MSLFALWKVWKIRLELARIQERHHGYRIKVKRRGPVRYAGQEIGQGWWYENHISPPKGKKVKLYIGAVDTMSDAKGRPQLWDVISIAREQAAGILGQHRSET